MKKRGKGKRAQEIFGLSFGMIFAMILIIFFIVMAIIVVTSFLNFQKCAKLGLYVKELKDRVDNAWNQGEGTSFEYKGFVPTEIQYICFINFNESFRGKNANLGTELKRYNRKNNFYFYPPKKSCDIAGHIIPHINIPQITQGENPFCIQTQSGKVSMRINMGDNGPLVVITR